MTRHRNLTTTLIAGAITSAALTTIADATTVNVDARTNSGSDMYAVALQLPLSDGTWQIRLRDDPTDLYDAWSPWATDDDPAAEGLPWTWRLRVDVPGVFSTGDYWAPSTTEFFPTKQGALGANLGRPPLVIILTEPATVYFWFSDARPWDNRGGVSVFAELLLDCPGDMNDDCFRNVSDFTLFAAAYGSHVGDPNYNPAADLNGNGFVNTTDLTLFAAVFGQPCP